jgi:peptidoglycan/LPS O-acetylase OafA/YrhL
MNSMTSKLPSPNSQISEPIPRAYVGSHLDQITGLRAYLALWVAVGHGLQSAGYLNLSGPLNVLKRGDAAVAIFIIISGFVITHLLLKGKETYSEYIVRRFFRLYPAYVLCCFVGYLLMGTWSELVRNVPWQAMSGWKEYAEMVSEIAKQSQENWKYHLPLHAIMLHGVLPNQILDWSAMTFLPAAWSISLEWQFYLVAPLVLYLLGLRTGRIGLLIMITLCYVFYSKGGFGKYPVLSFLPGAVGFFAIGISSRYAMPHLAKCNVNPLFFSAVAVFLLIAFCKDPLPLLVWMPFFSFLTWQKRAGFPEKVFSVITASPMIVRLGEISYSLYLVHRPVQIGFSTLILPTGAITHTNLLIAQLIAILLSIPISIALYRWVEKPGQAIGFTASRWMRQFKFKYIFNSRVVKNSLSKPEG